MPHFSQELNATPPLLDKAQLGKSALVGIKEEEGVIKEAQEMAQTLEEAQGHQGNIGGAVGKMDASAIVDGDHRGVNSKEKSEGEKDAIEQIIPYIPVVLPAAGGVLMFLLAFIAIYLA